MLANGFPLGVGTRRGALCRPCGSGKPGQPYAANLVESRAQATPAARCSRTSLRLKGISFRRWGRLALPCWPSWPCRPRSSKVKGFRAVSARGRAALSFWHGALWPGTDIWSLSTPTARASVAPWNSVARTAGTRERPRFPVCPPSGRPSPARPVRPCPRPWGFLRVTPGQVGGREGGGRDLGHHRWGQAGGMLSLGIVGGRGQPCPSPTMCPPGWQGPPARSLEAVYRLRQREKPERRLHFAGGKTEAV